MAVLLIVGLVFVVALGVFISLRSSKRQRLAGTAEVMGRFAAENGWRLGPPATDLPARAPHITELVGGLGIYLDMQLDGALHGVPFQAFQVRRPVRRGSVSTYTPEYAVALAPRPVPGPELLLAPRRLSWVTVLRRAVPTGDPAFDAAFHVSSDVPAFVPHVLRPPLTTWLASDPRVQGATLVLERGELMAVAQGPLTPDVAVALIGVVTDLHRQVPWGQLGGPPGPA